MAIGLERMISPVLESYPLSSMQQNMLAQSQYMHSPGLDIEQVIGDLNEPLDLPAFERAWKKVVQRHAILRTGFRWRDLAHPVQEVHPTVVLPFEIVEWQVSERDRARLFAEWLREDRAR